MPAVKAAKRAVAQLADTNPLRVYALAAQRRWEHEMRAAARAALGHPLHELYVQELEELSAGAYFRLLAYHRACAKAVAGRAADLAWMEPVAAKQGWQPGMGRCQSEECGGRWFMRYLATVRKALRMRPRADTLENPALVNAALNIPMMCQACRATMFSDLRMFNKLLAAEVERVLEEIELEIRWQAT